MSSGRMWLNLLVKSIRISVESKSYGTKQCWQYISFHIELFLEKKIFIKTCNFEPLFYVLKSVLPRREHNKKLFNSIGTMPSYTGLLVITPQLPTLT